MSFFHTFVIAAAALSVSASALVVFLAYRWTGSRALRAFFWFLIAFTGIAASSNVPPGWSGGGLRVRDILETASELVYLAALPHFVFGAVSVSVPRRMRILFHALYAVVSLYYLAAVFARVGPVFPVTAFSFALTIASVVFVWMRLDRVRDFLTRKLFRRFLAATALAVPLTLMDSVGTTLGWAWIEPFDRLSVAFYILAISGFVIAEAGRWLSHIARSAPDEAGGPASSYPVGAEDASEAAGAGPARLPSDAAFRFRDFGLSPRQIQIARLIVQGYSAKEMAAKLGISAKTAENHTYALYRRLGARSRLQFYAILRKGPPVQNS